MKPTDREQTLGEDAATRIVLVERYERLLRDDPDYPDSIEKARRTIRILVNALARSAGMLQ